MNTEGPHCAVQQNGGPDVRFGSKADIPGCAGHVCCAPDSGHQSDIRLILEASPGIRERLTFSDTIAVRVQRREADTAHGWHFTIKGYPNLRSQTPI